MNPVIWPAIVEIGFITWRSMTGTHYAVSTKGATGASLGAGGKLGAKGTGTTFININNGVKRPPLPSELLAVMLAFGVFGAIAEKDKRIGGLLAWGLVLATGFIAFGKGNTVGGTFPSDKTIGKLGRPVYSPGYPNQINIPPQGGR